VLRRSGSRCQLANGGTPPSKLAANWGTPPRTSTNATLPVWSPANGGTTNLRQVSRSGAANAVPGRADNQPDHRRNVSAREPANPIGAQPRKAHPAEGARPSTSEPPRHPGSTKPQVPKPPVTPPKAASAVRNCTQPHRKPPRRRLCTIRRVKQADFRYRINHNRHHRRIQHGYVQSRQRANP